MRGIVFFAAAVMAALLSQPVSADKQSSRAETSAIRTASSRNGITHIVHIQFDNVHFRRDNPNVPSDLE